MGALINDNNGDDDDDNNNERTKTTLSMMMMLMIILKILRITILPKLPSVFFHCKPLSV